ncbi:hypothetical protein BUALT_Bualt02G0086900 [Buddleja alternifolia]|uniref:Aminotransferase-like plant mobile domain-containing protein n=1 Tax=Buddleja alternifolia TaxID=168488 RepID=A0AAV6Y2T4_9LAMI|nr:hypothetical protein BUALT_Bualt02G0086900 [Buddleja alternifolia]
MYFEDQSEPIPSLVIRYNKDNLKVKSTILPVYEPAIDGHLTNTRSFAKSTHISVWFEEAAKECVHLRSAGGILISNWINFWFKGPVRHKEPPLHTTWKRTTRPKLYHNPCGDVDRSLLPRTKDHDEPFKTLDIDVELKEETYAAAFISCCLCSFVLLHHQTYRIHTPVFKVASRMAWGEHFSLAIPVLASIYRGLRIISSSKDLGESTAIFPIHYVYSWIGCYLPTHFYSRIKTVESSNGEVCRRSLLISRQKFQPSGDSAGSVNEVNPFNFPETNSPPHSSGNGVQVALENENHERPKITLPPRVIEELHANENTGKKLKRSFKAPSWPLAHPEAFQFSPNTIRKVRARYFLFGEPFDAQVKSAYAQREIQESHEKALQSVQQSLTEVEAQENEQAKDIKSRNDSLQRIHQQQEKLRKQLLELGQHEKIVSIDHTLCTI